LLIRGRSREDLLAELQLRMTPGPIQDQRPPDAEVTHEATSTDAAEAFAQVVAALPPLPELPGRVDVDHLPVSSVVPLAELPLLPLLVVDAARRGRALLRALLMGGVEPGRLDEWADAVRLATDFPELAERLAEATTGRSAELAAGVRAWSYGGAAGLEVFERRREPAADELARARSEVLAAAEEPVEVAVDGNRLTADGRQVRLDRVGRWHPYRRDRGDWIPAGPPDRDPVAALAAADG
jgi:hypothetical protein